MSPRTSPPRTSLTRTHDTSDGRSHLLGRYDGSGNGPVLVVVGGLHGNEPAGPAALRRVLAGLRSQRTPLRGTLVGLAGHPPALERRVRYFDRDLNRLWTPERVPTVTGTGEGRKSRSGDKVRAASGEPGGARVAVPGQDDTVESRQQASLLATIRELMEEAEAREICFLDLHTTSSESVPFVTFSDSLESRALGSRLPLAAVLGVEEEVEGTLLDYLDDQGYAAVCVEGGRHEDPRSVDRLEAAIWLTLMGLEMLELPDVPGSRELRGRLAEAGRRVPPLFEVRYRHGLREGDGFRMRPGFRNFQEVRRNELLGEDRRGPVHAPFDGRIFLPLYQTKGEEGFFLVREVSPVWLRLSALLRRLGAERLVRWLPGVRPHPRRPEAVTVAPAAAPFLVRLLHLLGYRRERTGDGRLVLSRRRVGSRPGP